MKFKFSIDNSSLFKTAASVCGTNNSLNIYDNVVIKARQGLVQFRVVNDQHSHSFVINAEVETDGEVCINGATFFNLVMMFKTNIIVESDSANQYNVIIRHQKSKYRIQGTDVGNFPPIQSCTKYPYKFKTEVLRPLLANNLFDIKAAEGSSILSSMLLRLEKKNAIVFSADNTRLVGGVCNNLLAEDTALTDILIPFKSLRFVLDIFNTSSEVFAELGTGTVEFKTENNQKASVKRPAGMYPNISAIHINRASEDALVNPINRVSLLQALSRLRTSWDQISSVINLELNPTDKTLTIAGTNATTSGVEVITAIDVPKSVKLAMNGSVLLDFCNNSDSEVIELVFSKDLRKIQLEGKEDPYQVKMLTTPIQTKTIEVST